MELTQEAFDALNERLEAAERANQGLKADLSKAKAKAKGAEIDPELHAELQSKVEELTSQLSKVQKESTKQIETLTKQLSEKEGAVSKYLIDSQLSDSLAKVGVKPEFMEAAKSLLKGQTTVKTDNGEYQALIGDKGIFDFVKEWSAGDSGKHFVQAPANSGGGAGGDGGSGSGGAKQMTRAQFDAADVKTKSEFSKAGGKITD